MIVPAHTIDSSDTSGLKPYFRAEGGRSGAPRLLLISYYFPPDPSVGGLRWQETAKHFAEHGWVTDAVTRDFSGLPGLDLGRLGRLPGGMRVFTARDREPLLGRAHRRLWPLLKSRLRSHGRSNEAGLSRAQVFEQQIDRGAIRRAYLAWLAFARDAEWARQSSAVALSVARTTAFRVVISSGPPHMAHVAGVRVAQATNLPLIVDMRDPWSLSERLPDDTASPAWFALARHHERRVLRHAALVVMNTEQSRDAMRAQYPTLADRFATIRNGSDDDEIPTPQRDRKFRIRFAGSIYIDRDPRPLFRAAARVISELAIGPAQLAIEFIGHVETFSGTSVMEIARQEGIEHFVSVGGRVPRREALEFLAGATMLLNLPQDNDLAVPAKIYEYVKMNAWMLVLASKNSATGQLLKDSDARVVEPQDIDGIAHILRSCFEDFSRGVNPQPVGRSGRFDRRIQSGKFLQLITKVVADHAPPHTH